MNELREIKCRTCKENLDIRKAKDGVIECPYCASVYTLPKEGATSEVLHFLNMGEHDLDICDWEGAFSAFKKAAEKDETEPEAYWGLALSDYKVQCIKDYVNNRMQPVCHEISERKFSDSRDYKKALKYATKTQSEEYAKKAAEIDYIKEEFYKLKQSELDFDSFICVKVTDENGKQTEDCKDAEYIYNLLKDKGYSPFFSEISIRNRTGTDYEAMILYALYSSETMLVVCRDEKYLQTPWVKNEYTRFLHLVNDEEKENDSITLIYYERPVEKLPGKRGKLQGIDLSRSEAEEQITDFVEKHTPQAKKRREEALRRKEEEARRKTEEAEAQARRIKELQEQVDALRESNANAAFSMNEILEKMEAARIEQERERAEEEARLKAEEEARKKAEEEARSKAEQGGIINKAEEQIKKLLFKAAKKVFGDKTEDSPHKKDEERETQTKTPDKENEQPENKRSLFDEFFSDDNGDKGVSPDNDLLKAEKLYNQGLEFFNKKKYSEAVKWYTMSAERGYALAQNTLGLCYKNGIGVNQNYSEAVKWYERAARQGYSVAQYNLGYCYYNGQGVMQDYSEAVKWYTRSAEQGNAIAQYNLGNFYKSGIRQDYTEAAKWYERAAMQGESKAQRNLGNFYYKGRGLRQDYAEAVKWYTRSAEQGDATAQYNLGLCYENGKGVKQNYREAIKWYTRAAKQGDVDAQKRLKILKNRYGIQA